MIAGVAMLRLRAQRIAASEWKTPVEVARGMLALQAQDFFGVLWSLGLRAPGTTLADVEAAFARARIVRSWPLRGTLHVTAAEDLPWMLALLAPRVVAAARRRREALSLDERTLERARAVAVRALEGGKHATREELQRTWEAAGIRTTGQRGYHMLFHLAATRTLVLGPTVKRVQSFALLEEWVKKPRKVEGDAALRELARRYFGGHGPATIADFAGWAKLTLREAKAAIALAGRTLEHVEIDGGAYVIPAGLLDAARAKERDRDERPRERDVFLLPGFDELVLGYKAREAVIDAAHMQKIVPGGNGMFISTIVVGGRVVGTWRRTQKAKATVLEAQPFAKLDAPTKKSFMRAAEAYGRFLGVSVDARVSGVNERCG
jgi:hypothetical protein